MERPRERGRWRLEKSPEDPCEGVDDIDESAFTIFKSRGHSDSAHTELGTFGERVKRVCSAGSCVLLWIAACRGHVEKLGWLLHRARSIITLVPDVGCSGYLSS